jgi:hypothetical protein
LDHRQLLKVVRVLKVKLVLKVTLVLKEEQVQLGLKVPKVVQVLKVQ